MTQNNLDLPEELDLAEFVAREAHDLKSPFNRILGFTRLLQKGLSGPLTELQQDDLATIYDNGSQALTAINNLVEMARLARGEKTFSPAETNLSSLLEETVAVWKQQNPAEVDLSLPPEALHLTLDKSLLRQGLLHWFFYLAEYHTPPARLTVNLRASESGAQITLQSTGAKNPAAAKMLQTMNAYIGRAILKLHGGQVLQATGDEQGAVIQFSLPRQ